MPMTAVPAAARTSNVRCRSPDVVESAMTVAVGPGVVARGARRYRTSRPAPSDRESQPGTPDTESEDGGSSRASGPLIASQAPALSASITYATCEPVGWSGELRTLTIPKAIEP